MIDIQDLYPILHLLDKADAGWCIFGSAARWLDGEDTDPQDIDIIMSEEGAAHAEILLAPYRLHTPQQESGKWRSRRSHYLVGHTEIDLSGGLQQLREGEWKSVAPMAIKEKRGVKYTRNLSI